MFLLSFLSTAIEFKSNHAQLFIYIYIKPKLRSSSILCWQMETLLKKNKSGKVKATKKKDIANLDLMNKKLKIAGDGVKASQLILLLLPSNIFF